MLTVIHLDRSRVLHIYATDTVAHIPASEWFAEAIHASLDPNRPPPKPSLADVQALIEEAATIKAAIRRGQYRGD
jgi:hypothetical protein